MAFWNERDPILKERYFGLIPTEANHGEDVKECYFYLDAVPSHAYQRMLYKYPQRAFPYAELIQENERRGATDPDLELIDSGIFDDGRYFVIFIDAAKDAFHGFIVNGEQEAVNPENRGTKMCGWQRVEIEPGGSHVMRMRVAPPPSAALRVAPAPSPPSAAGGGGTPLTDSEIDAIFD